jgi:ribosomal protein S27E
MINLNSPIRSERIRAGFQPHWRTVFIYKCKDCGHEMRVFANSFMGKNPVPGVGSIICSRCDS